MENQIREHLQAARRRGWDVVEVYGDAGISGARAVAQGVRLGRPKIDRVTERKVRRLLAKGVGILTVAKSLGIGTGTVQRISGERAMSLRGAEQ